MKYDNAFEQQLVIARLEDFDIHSGNRLERLLFNNRLAIVAVCMVITIVLGFQATRLHLNASFERMIPTQHPYIANYFENRNELPGLGNSIRIAVETVHSTIFDAIYLEMLRKINDDAFFIPGRIEVR